MAYNNDVTESQWEAMTEFEQEFLAEQFGSQIGDYDCPDCGAPMTQGMMNPLDCADWVNLPECTRKCGFDVVYFDPLRGLIERDGEIKPDNAETSLTEAVREVVELIYFSYSSIAVAELLAAGDEEANFDLALRVRAMLAAQEMGLVVPVGLGFHLTLASGVGELIKSLDEGVSKVDTLLKGFYYYAPATSDFQKVLAGLERIGIAERESLNNYKFNAGF